MIQSILAHVAMFLILFGTSAVVSGSRLMRTVFGRSRPLRRPGSMHVLLTGTFYNEAWYRSHVRPLVKAKTISLVSVVTEQPLEPFDKVSYICPPRWATRLLGRSFARALTVVVATARRRPDVVMGYHIMPNALVCLVAASLFGGQSVYQMTGGPIQIIGGGCGSENTLLRRLGRPSALLERLLFHVLRSVDLIVVRGEQARRFVVERGLGRACMVLTGSIDTERFRPSDEKPVYDAVCVSRLVPCKGIEYLLNVVGELRRLRSDVRVAIVGDGELRCELERQCESLGLSGNVTFLGKRGDVESIMRQSRLFVLTSPSEGMSIAMLEGLGAGLPGAVTDVGELRDCLHDGENGIFLCGDAAGEDAKRLHELLRDESRLAEMSRAARSTIERGYSAEAIAGCWDSYLSDRGDVGTRLGRRDAAHAVA